MSTKTNYDFLSQTVDQAVETMVAAINADVSVMLWGSPGIGKTTVTQAVGNALGFDSIIVINPATTDVIDLRLPTIETDEQGNKTLRQVLSKRLPTTGRHLIVVDEINSCPPSMQTTLNSLVLDKRIDDWTAPNGTAVVATGNRESDRCSANPMPQQSRDRFLHVNLIPDVDNWSKWATKHSIRPEVVAFVRQFPETLDGFSLTDPTAGCTPRSLVRLSKMLDQNISRDVLAIVAQGCLGQGEGVRFIGFLDLFANGINVDDCLTNPTTATLPDRADLAFALCSALASRVNKKNVVNAFRYIERLQLSHQVIAVGDIKRRCPDVAKTKTFLGWIIQNQDVIL